jgi:hypothetical protein
MSDTPDNAFSINQSQLPQSNVAAFNQVGRDLSQTVNVYAGVLLTETLQQLLYHHESATIFANRLDSFVGREAEIAEIRPCLFGIARWCWLPLHAIAHGAAVRVQDQWIVRHGAMAVGSAGCEACEEWG